MVIALRRNVAAVAGLPALTLQDGPAGVARFTGSPHFRRPSRWCDLDATWCTLGRPMGAQNAGKGVMISWAMMNLRGRPAGRNFRASARPLPVGSLPPRTGRTKQRVSPPKHYDGNEQETNRDTAIAIANGRSRCVLAPLSRGETRGSGAVRDRTTG